MATSTNKKVQICRFNRERLSGYVNQSTYLLPDGIEILTLGGKVSVHPYAELKSLTFVRDFDETDGFPERRAFQTRPKLEGLWVRSVFLDGDFLEGIVQNNLLYIEPFGFTIVPPDFSSNHQRLFLPKAALREVHVLGVIGRPLRHARKPRPAAKDQIALFE